MVAATAAALALPATAQDPRPTSTASVARGGPPVVDLPPPVVSIPAAERLQSLQSAYMPVGPGAVLVGYLDGRNGVFYKWRGVRLPERWIWPSPHGGSGPGSLSPDLIETMLSVDPPLDYVIGEEGLAEPGYYDDAFPRFYRWQGVRFDVSKIDAGLLGIERDPDKVDDRTNEQPFGIRDIPVPAHRQPLADRLNATTQPAADAPER